ncbi:protein trapped in endoderm-1-like [Argonauta hians]
MAGSRKHDSLPVEYMLGFFVIFGAIGNTLAICVFARKKEKLPHTIFIITLAVTDFLTCSIIVPMTIYMLHINFETNSTILCRVYHFLITFNVPFSAFIMVAIAVERYLSVCHPFLHLMKPKSTLFTILTMLLFCSSLGLITSLCHGIKLSCKTPSLPSMNTFQNYNVSKKEIFNMTEYFESDGVFSSENVTNSSFNVVDVENSSQQNCTRYVCSFTTKIFSLRFLHIYQKVYAFLFLLSFLSTLVLYGLIYHSIFWRRAKRWKGHKKQQQILKNSNGGALPSAHTADAGATEMSVLKATQANVTADFETTVATEKNNSNKEIEVTLKKGNKSNTLKRQITMKDKNRFANFKLAVMLFVVNLVFICSFLPAWLMAIKILKFTPIIFYMYFSYNVANPVIYAFLNPTFRRDLYTMMCLGTNKRSSRQYI